MTVTTYTPASPGTGTFSCPSAGTLQIEAYSSGAAGGSGNSGHDEIGGPGGSGSYGIKTTTVTNGQNITYAHGTVPSATTFSSETNGGNGANVTITVSSVTYTAGGGVGGTCDDNGGVSGAGGVASGPWDTAINGNTGATGTGNNAAAGPNGVGPLGGTGGSNSGGNGGSPGGGGGGGPRSGPNGGGGGGDWRIIFTFTATTSTVVARRGQSPRTGTRNVT